MRGCLARVGSPGKSQRWQRDGRESGPPLTGSMAQDGWQLVYTTSRKLACPGPSPMSIAQLQPTVSCRWLSASGAEVQMPLDSGPAACPGVMVGGESEGTQCGFYQGHLLRTSSHFSGLLAGLEFGFFPFALKERCTFSEPQYFLTGKCGSKA